MNETICYQCLGTGSHPQEDPETNEYRTVNCERCMGYGIENFRPLSKEQLKRKEILEKTIIEFERKVRGVPHNGIK